MAYLQFNMLFLVLCIAAVTTLGSITKGKEFCSGLAACQEADYAKSLSALKESLLTGSKDLKAASIDILSPKISYTSTFEQYELKNRPFKANFEIQADENSVASILNLDYNEFYGRMYPLSDMVGRVDSNGLVVPKFAVNNYLLPGKHIESSAADSSYFTQWPAVMPLSARYQTSSGFQCPSNMHLLAWHYAVEGAEISARLFPISASAEYFESALFSEAARSEQLQANLTTSPFSGYFNRYLRHGFPATKGKGSDSREDSNAELPPFAETKLTSSEYIFVPNNYLASFQCNPQSTSDHTDADSNDDKVHCAILALCFVDASNLNLFRDSVFLNGKVSVLEVTVHAAVTSPTFDPQMLKQPADVYLREYWTAGVRDSKDNSDSSAMSSQTPAPPVSAVSPPDAARRDRRRRGSADFKDWQDSNKWKTLITSLTIPAPPAPHLLAVGRDHASLSWSSPFVPPQSDKTSFGFRIIFCKLADGPQRTESFALPFASAAPDPDCESSKLLRGSDGGAGRSGGLLVLEEELDAALLRRTGVESVLFKTVLRSPSPPPLLLPDTLYQLRLVICYDQWESPPSPYSAPFRTKSQTVPSSPLALPLAHADPSVTVSTIDPAILASTRTVTAVHGGRRVVGLLEFAWPSDDGGLPIIGFHVYGRSVPFRKSPAQANGIIGAEGGMHAEGGGDARNRLSTAVADLPWLWFGAFPGQRVEGNGVVELYNLPPLSSYQFKVAAYNKIGSSALSVSSNVMHYTLKDGGHHVLHGWGHSHYFGSLTAQYLVDHAPLLSVTEAESHHGAVALQMAASNFTALACSGDNGMDKSSVDLLVIDALSEVMYSSCIHGHIPKQQTDVFEVWRSHWTSSSVSVHATAAVVDQLVQRELPSGRLVDSDGGGRLRGKIVFSPRGSIPFVEKARRVATAGGLALVVVDDGRCELYDQRCLPGADKSSGEGEGFGAQDVFAHWEQIDIPVFFILQKYAVRWAKQNEMMTSPFAVQHLFSSHDDEL